MSITSIDQITSIDDLRGTKWQLNETLIKTNSFSINNNLTEIYNVISYESGSTKQYASAKVAETSTTKHALLTYGNNLGLYLNYYNGTYNLDYPIATIKVSNVSQYTYGEGLEELPRLLEFHNWNEGDLIIGSGSLEDLKTWLSSNTKLIMSTLVKVNGKTLNKANGKQVGAIHYGEKTWWL